MHSATGRDSTAGANPSPTRIVVLGRDTCEDTSIVRSRLEALGVPFEYGNSDADPATGDRIRALNGGHLVTPTVVVGDEERILTEPSVEDVDRMAADAGHAVSAPVPVRLHAPHIDTPILRRRLPAPGLFDPVPPTPWANRQVAVFFPHDAACLACFGYARQLARQQAALDEVDGSIAVIVPGEEPPGHWATDLSGVAVVHDPEAGWREEVAEALAIPADGALALLLDRYLAPRVVAAAGDAGGLIAPGEVTAWLGFTVLDCSECSTELPWS